MAYWSNFARRHMDKNGLHVIKIGQTEGRSSVTLIQIPCEPECLRVPSAKPRPMRRLRRPSASHAITNDFSLLPKAGSFSPAS
jgi:hypothetical protein